jgi:hypothetical protein
MGEHADITASGSKRWITCTPSIALEKSFPDKESEYAAEGSLAHKIGEIYIKIALKMGDLSKLLHEAIDLKKHPLYKPEMKRYMEGYRDYVLEQYAQALKESKEAKIYIERRLNLDHIIPGGFGTGDIIIVWPGSIRLIDLKYGQGVKVDAEENTQQMLYACGALREFATAFYTSYDIYITIYQPRLDHFDTWATTSTDLMSWATNTAIPAAKAAFEGTGVYIAGEHCRFCKAIGQCKAIAEYNLEIARDVFEGSTLLSTSEIANIILKSSIFTSWIDAVKDHAISKVRAGQLSLPGLKLVEGISRRKYKDEAAIAKILLEDAMVTEEEIYKKELIGFGDMENLLGKKNFNLFVGHQIIKPDGAPTLVPVTDKRPAIGSAEAAQLKFKDIK